MNLFSSGEFTLAGGSTSDFKIECDALTEDDWATLARLISQRVQPFATVVSVPLGGDRLAAHIVQYIDPDAEAILVVDDVFTTGASIEAVERTIRSNGTAWEVFGAVVFARDRTPPWITPLFSMTP